MEGQIQVKTLFLHKLLAVHVAFTLFSFPSDLFSKNTHFANIKAICH